LAFGPTGELEDVGRGIRVTIDLANAPAVLVELMLDVGPGSRIVVISSRSLYAYRCTIPSLVVTMARRPPGSYSYRTARFVLSGARTIRWSSSYSSSIQRSGAADILVSRPTASRLY
jgi:hypothetical protein